MIHFEVLYFFKEKNTDLLKLNVAQITRFNFKHQRVGYHGAITVAFDGYVVIGITKPLFFYEMSALESGCRPSSQMWQICLFTLSQKWASSKTLDLLGTFQELIKLNHTAWMYNYELIIMNVTLCDFCYWWLFPQLFMLFIYWLFVVQPQVVEINIIFRSKQPQAISYTVFTAILCPNNYIHKYFGSVTLLSHKFSYFTAFPDEPTFVYI